MKTMASKTSFIVCITVISLITAIALIVRPLIPIDETRYAGVAWEMWHQHHFLVPLLNGEAYSHKPPLLFWLVYFVWQLFGINDWVLRVLPAMFATGSLFFTYQLAKKMWPKEPRIAIYAPLVLLSSVFFCSWVPLFRFDVLLTFFVIAALNPLYAAMNGNKKSLILFAGIVGVGILVKGPVILLFTFLPAMVVPFKQNLKPFKWAVYILLAFLITAVIPLLWAIPAAYFGGKDYAQAIFLGQTTGRIFSSFAHAHPWWWYFPTLPLIFFPWSFCPGVWQGVVRLFKEKIESNLRFLLACIVPGFICFMLISGKQTRYLLPFFPSVAILMTYFLFSDKSNAYLKTKWPIALTLLGFALLFLLPTDTHILKHFYISKPWFAHVSFVWGFLLLLLAGLILFLRTKSIEANIIKLSIVSVFIVIIYFIAVNSVQAHHRDVRDFSQQIAGLQHLNNPIAFIGDYEDQFHFYGRLKKPIRVVSDSQLKEWVKQHENGWIIQKVSKDKMHNLHLKSFYSYRYDKDFFILWRAEDYS